MNLEAFTVVFRFHPVCEPCEALVKGKDSRVDAENQSVRRL